MNLRILAYLVALADTRHFGKAADACHVTQPTLSAQIKKLEEQLGVVLIERQPRNILLTPVGAAVVARARRMLRDAEEIEVLARASHDPLGGLLRIGLIPTLGPYLLPHFVAAVRESLPRLRCEYFEYQTDPLLARVRAGHIDVALLALPVNNDQLEVRRLFNEAFRLAVNRDDPLAERSSVGGDELPGKTLLLLEDGHCLRDQALEICALAGMRENEGFRATSLETLRQMVAAGAGLTLLPQLAADADRANSDDVVAIPFAEPSPHRQIAAIWRASSARHAAIEALCDTIGANLPELS